MQQDFVVEPALDACFCTAEIDARIPSQSLWCHCQTLIWHCRLSHLARHAWWERSVHRTMKGSVLGKQSRSRIKIGKENMMWTCLELKHIFKTYLWSISCPKPKVTQLQGKPSANARLCLVYSSNWICVFWAGNGLWALAQPRSYMSLGVFSLQLERNWPRWVYFRWGVELLFYEKNNVWLL